MFSVSVVHEEADDTYGHFEFAVNGVSFCYFNPYEAGSVNDWAQLIDLIDNPPQCRTVVRFDDSDFGYCISAENGTMTFSTDWHCTGSYPAVDVTVPAAACRDAFVHMRDLLTEMSKGG